MKARILLALLVGTGCFAFAQSASPPRSTQNGNPVEALRREHWNYGFWFDYGNGIGYRSGVHMGGAGLRIGRVMTGELGTGWRRGTFELDADLTPLEIYSFPETVQSSGNLPPHTFYTGGLTPVIMKWNFTSGNRWVPFVAAQGGLVFSTTDLPPGDTASVNFTPGASIGFHRFVHDRSAWTFEGKLYHLSNASLGPHNPGVNAAVQFKVGYTWFKR